MTKKRRNVNGGDLNSSIAISSNGDNINNDDIKSKNNDNSLESIRKEIDLIIAKEKELSENPSLPEKDDPSVLIARLLQDMETLRNENVQLRTEIQSERELKDELLSEKNILNAEIEELTKNLFEEANGMVASEAKARWNVEQAQKRLETELIKTQELLSMESEQNKFLRELVEEEKQQQRNSDPVLWDVDVFGSRLCDSYYDDFFPCRAFNSRDHSSANHWDLLSNQTAESAAYRLFSSFVDECFRIGNRNGGKLSEDSIMTILGHKFMQSCLQADIEPCLAFPVLERTSKTKSMLKKLLPAMLKNTCLIEPIPSSSSSVNPHNTLPFPDSSRASPVSIKSFISVTANPSRESSPVKSKHLASRSLTSSPIKSTSTTAAIDIRKKQSILKIEQIRSNESPNGFNSLLTSFVGSHPESGVLSNPFFNVSSAFGSSPTTSVTSVESCPVSPIGSQLKCSMCDLGEASLSTNGPPTHRFRIVTSLNETLLNSPTKQQLPWTIVCRACRDRLVSVASFFVIIRHLLQGVHTHRPKIDVFFDVLQAKRYMFYSRSGVSLAFFALSDFEAFSQKIQEHL